MIRSVALLAIVSTGSLFVFSSCNDATGGCTYDADCPGIEKCVNGECVPNRCPEVPCSSGETCVNGNCYQTDCPGMTCGENQVCQDGLCIDITCLEGECQCETDADCPPGFRCDNDMCVRTEAGNPGAQTFTAGGASLSSENYRFELFIAPVCPTGSLQSTNHRLHLGPAAYAKPEP